MGTRRISLDVPGTFRLDLTVWALRRRPHNALDMWDGQHWRRSVETGHGAAELRVYQTQERGTPRLLVTVNRCGAPPERSELVEARRLVTRTLGLEVDLGGFYAMAEGDRRLLTLARRFVGLRPPCFPDVFEALVNAVACQQLSLDVGIHLINRLARRFGTASGIGTAPPIFPTPEQLAAADPVELRELGFSRAKARTLVSLGQRVMSGEVDLAALEALDDQAARDLLLALPGIGRWSAEYVLLRGLGRLQMLPGDDVGARNGLRRRFGLAADGGYDAVADLSRRWWPYGGLVYFHLLLDRLAEQGHVEVRPLETMDPARSSPPGPGGQRPPGRGSVPRRSSRSPQDFPSKF